MTALDPHTPAHDVVGILLHLHPDDAQALGGVRTAATKLHDQVRNRARDRGGPGSTSVIWTGHHDGDAQLMQEYAKPPSIMVGPNSIADELGALRSALTLDMGHLANVTTLGLAVLAALHGVPDSHVHTLAGLTADDRGGLPLSTSEVLARAVCAHVEAGRHRLARGDEDDTVTVLVGTNSDTDEPYMYRGAPGDADGEAGLFEAQVPAVLMDALDAAYTTVRTIHDTVLAAAGYDADQARMAVCCPVYDGERSPGTTPSWFVAVPPSGDPDVWPAGDRPALISWGFDTPAVAHAARAQLPDVIHLWGHGGPMPKAVQRDTLVVTEQPGFGGYWPACTRCGWDRDDHQVRAARPDDQP